MWGSVLQVAGNMYRENTGTILGELAGKAFLMDFNFDAISGTFWICMERNAPVKVTLTFLNHDCGEYSLEVDESSVFNEQDLEAAWLGLQFDLVTAQKKSAADS